MILKMGIRSTKPVAMAAVNVGVAHSNKCNFLQHSEEPAGWMKSLGGLDLARGPEFETPVLHHHKYLLLYYGNL